MDEMICELEVHEDIDYNVTPSKVVGYHVDVTVYLGDRHVTFGPLTPDQVRQMAKQLVEDLDFNLGIFSRLTELRTQAELKSPIE